MAPGPSLSSYQTQFFPPQPSWTEKSLTNLNGNVYIVSGANTGIGKEVARILYSKNATVYVAARSEPKALAAITEIKKSHTASEGKLHFLSLDLADLNNVKKSCADFLARETKLDVLFNNAGVMGSNEKPNPQSVQGHDLLLGVNCIGTLLFTELLTPLLQSTARTQPRGSVRVVWLSSFGLELFAAEGKGVDLDEIASGKLAQRSATERYGVSKTGAWALGVDYARRHKADGITSVSINPGNLKTELPRDQSFAIKMAARLVGYSATHGAYTELYAAFSPDVLDMAPEEWGKF